MNSIIVKLSWLKSCDILVYLSDFFLFKIVHYVFISKYRYEALYAKMLPESMLGETFLERYADHNDSVTVIDHKRSYGVRANARHPIYENFRVKVSNSF